jgi:hypothetical protein
MPAPVRLVMKLFMKSTDEGAMTTLHCATSPAIAGTTGKFYVKSAEKAASAVATPALATELWERSEAWTAPSAP